VDDHGEALTKLVHAITDPTSSRPESWKGDERLAALGRRAIDSFEAVRQQALVLDDSLRAIAMIARAGRDTQKVRRALREIVADQNRLAASRDRSPSDEGER
jgi:hypothetical protein